MTEKQFYKAKHIREDIVQLEDFMRCLNKSDDFNFEFMYKTKSMSAYKYIACNNLPQDLVIYFKDTWIKAVEQKIEELEKEFAEL